MGRLRETRREQTAKATRKAKEDAKPSMDQRRQAAAETKAAKKKRGQEPEALRLEHIAAFKENGATDPRRRRLVG